MPMKEYEEYRSRYGGLQEQQKKQMKNANIAAMIMTVLGGVGGRGGAQMVAGQAQQGIDRMTAAQDMEDRDMKEAFFEKMAVREHDTKMRGLDFNFEQAKKRAELEDLKRKGEIDKSKAFLDSYTKMYSSGMFDLGETEKPKGVSPGQAKKTEKIIEKTPLSGAEIRELHGIQTPEEEMEMQKAAVELQTKIVELEQKAFDLQTDQLLLPQEYDKMVADIERIKANTVSAYKSGNASDALTALRNAQTETEGIEQMLKAKELFGTGEGETDYGKWAGFSKEHMPMYAKRHIKEQLQNAFVDGYDSTLDTAARAVREQGWTSIDEYIKMVQDVVGEYNKPVTDDQLLGMYQQVSDDILVTSANKFTDLLPSKQNVVKGYAMGKGYQAAEEAGKWINRNDTADLIKSDIEKFKKDLEALLGVKDAGVAALENEWF